jgi:hypothetical protein
LAQCWKSSKYEMRLRAYSTPSQSLTASHDGMRDRSSAGAERGFGLLAVRFDESHESGHEFFSMIRRLQDSEMFASYVVLERLLANDVITGC